MQLLKSLLKKTSSIKDYVLFCFALCCFSEIAIVVIWHQELRFKQGFVFLPEDERPGLIVFNLIVGLISLFFAYRKSILNSDEMENNFNKTTGLENKPWAASINY